MDINYVDTYNSGIVVGWICEEGWGELNFYYDSTEKKWHCDSEAMCSNDNKNFIKRVFDAFVADLEVDS